MIRFFPLSILLLVCCKLSAQPSAYYRVGDFIQFEKIIPTHADGALVIGYRYVSYSNPSGVLILLDSNGRIEWMKTYDYNQTLRFNCAYEVSDGFNIGGSFGNSAVLMKVDYSGNVLFAKIIDGLGKGFSINNFEPFQNELLANCSGFVFKIDTSGNLSALGPYETTVGSYGQINCLIADSNYIYLTGENTQDGLGCYGTGYILKKDMDGKVIWYNNKIRVDGLSNNSIDGGYINADHTFNVLMNSTNDLCTNSDITFAHISSDGDEISHQSFVNGTKDSALFSSFFGLNPDSSCSVCFSAGGGGCVVAEFSKQGELYWSNVYSLDSVWEPSAIMKSGSNYITVVGNRLVRSFNGFILNVDSNGSGCGERTFPLKSKSTVLSIDHTNFNSPVDTNYSVSLVQVTVSENIQANQLCGFGTNSPQTPLPHISINPNPFDQSFDVTLKESNRALMSIYDLNGSLIFSDFIHKNYHGGDFLRPGLYLIKINLDNGECLTEKILKVQ